MAIVAVRVEDKLKSKMEKLEESLAVLATVRAANAEPTLESAITSSTCPA